MSCTQYTDILDDKTATYKLFSVLEKKFNGDMLPLVAHEFEMVTQSDLYELKSFLVGDSNLESHQLALWPLYDFNIIPIQIISSIYKLFFHLSDTEDDITQEWFVKIQQIWDSRNRATSLTLNGLIPMHQYADNAMKKAKGRKSPTIDFCFKDWATSNSYFGAEAKNLYDKNPKKSNDMLILG